MPDPTHEMPHVIQQPKGTLPKPAVRTKTSPGIKATVKPKPTPAAKVRPPSPDLNNYITNLVYDPNEVLSIVPDGTTSSQPVKDRQAVGNAVIICTKIQPHSKRTCRKWRF